MIIVDTNVLSEALKQSGEPLVISWLDKQSSQTLYITSTIYAELLLGIAVMPVGKRRNTIFEAFDGLIGGLFAGRILPFDQSAALVYSAIVSAARAGGKTPSFADGQIGAVAKVHGFQIASRDVTPFSAMGLAVINPWKD